MPNLPERALLRWHTGAGPAAIFRRRKSCTPARPPARCDVFELAAL